MNRLKKSQKEILIQKLSKEGKVKDVPSKVYTKSVRALSKDMLEVTNEFKILNLESTASASDVVLHF